MEWRGLDDRLLGEGAHGGIMGILNVTPDSFSDGGQCSSALAACHKARQMLAAGAHIIDIGAESTRPGAKPTSPEEEASRLLPALKTIRSQLPEAAVSVDTRNSQTARLALEYGAMVINDVSGLRHDAKMLDVIAQYRPGYVLMHSQGDPEHMAKNPRYGDVIEEILNFFETGLHRLTKAGLPENRVLLDPGIGFGKTFAHNLQIIRNLSRFLSFGRPLLVGISRKSFFGHLLDLPVHDRDSATAIASALLYVHGASWHRVHNVEATRLALRLAKSFAVEI